MNTCPICGYNFEYRPVSRIVALVRFAHWAKENVRYYDLRFDKKYRIAANKWALSKDGWIRREFRCHLGELWRDLGNHFLCGNIP